MKSFPIEYQHHKKILREIKMIQNNMKSDRYKFKSSIQEDLI